MFFESPVPFAQLRLPAGLTLSCRWLTRQLMMLCGIVMVLIGVVGIFLPLVPTTGPLIAGSFFLAKGSPRLQRMLCENQLTGRYLRYIDGTLPMPMHARVQALVLLWGSISSGVLLLAWCGMLNSLVATIYGIGGVIGTVFIVRMQKRKAVPIEADCCSLNPHPVDTQQCSQEVDEAVLKELLSLSVFSREAVNASATNPRRGAVLTGISITQ